ncbi:MAG: hypothetical protein AAGC60_15855 [Acidobacteriota bacterium]
MIPLPLRTATAHRLEFAHRPVGGWVAAAVAGILYGGLLHLAGGWSLLTSTNAGLFATFVCGSVFGVGLFLGLWRHDLVVDRRSRRWTRTRGVWPLMVRSEGVLGAAARVVLGARTKRHSGLGQNESYAVELVLGAGVPPVVLGRRTARVLGQRLMVEMARRLEVPAVDRSGRGAPVTTPHDELKMPDDPHATKGY